MPTALGHKVANVAGKVPADLVAFRGLMRLAALRTGQMLNQSEIGRDAHLNAMTVSRYLGLLEISFIVHRIPPYLGNRASRLMKSPKLYFADAGLAAHLAGVADLDSTKDEPMRGALIETYVAQNILASPRLAKLCKLNW